MAKLTEAGVRLIKSFEGCRLTAYKPVAAEKYWTIGWGHYGPDVTQGMKITQQQADDMLIADLNRTYVPATEKVCLGLPLSNNAFSALVSFSYNCGAGGLASSTGMKLMRQGKMQAGIDALAQWNKGADGKVLPGLVRRRAAEKVLFNTPDPESALPESALP